MSFKESMNRLFLVPISLDVQGQRKALLEKNPQRSPLPYTEFSVSDLLNRAFLGVQVGDIVQTSTLSSCVITEIQPTGTMIIHSTYWDEASHNWRSLGERITIQHITALLGYRFDEQQAKQYKVVQPDY